MRDAIPASSPGGYSRSANDRGFSLAELMVAISVMAVVLAIITGALVSMYRATSKVEGITSTSAQISIAMSRLDSSVRYADVIDEPRNSAGNWYVTFRSTYNGTASCTQLWLDPAAQQLKQRTWTALPPTSPGTWQLLASQIHISTVDGSPVPPFETTTTQGSGEVGALGQQQLWLRFSAISGAGDRQTLSTTGVRFTAFNSNLDTMLSRDQSLANAKCEAVTP